MDELRHRYKQEPNCYGYRGMRKGRLQSLKNLVTKMLGKMDSRVSQILGRAEAFHLDFGGPPFGMMAKVSKEGIPGYEPLPKSVLANLIKGKLIPSQLQVVEPSTGIRSVQSDIQDLLTVSKQPTRN
jgi:hypothetical protein